MADNINDDTLDNPIIPQSENLSDEIISTTETDTIISNQETANMEVHKHPHHVTHKKKWGEYVLEFLMLFLAVFLGFVAENLREQRVDKAKEKEYMVSMLLDLKNDTLSINNSIFKNRLLIAGVDSTLHFLSGNLHNQDTAEIALLYFYKYCLYLNFEIGRAHV